MLYIVIFVLFWAYLSHIILVFVDVCVYVCGKALELLQAREMTDHSAFLPTFMVELDIVLHGGLLAGSITEVRCFYLEF